MNLTAIIILTVSNLIVIFLTILILKLTIVKKVCNMFISMNKILANMYSLMSGVAVEDIFKPEINEEENDEDMPEWYKG